MGRGLPLLCPVAFLADRDRSGAGPGEGSGGSSAGRITPDPWTATPLWYGEPLDLRLAMDTLRPLGRASRDGKVTAAFDEGC